MSEHVVLLHGIWMRGFTLAALCRRLEKAGYAVDLFDYSSVLERPDSSIDKLSELTQALRRQNGKTRKVHFVGHSLGGLVALHALRRDPRLTSGCVVCVGSPLRGSAIARTLHQWGGGFVLGKSAEVLLHGMERWEGTQAVGSIAGRLSFGVGLVFGSLSSPHDGTVSVEETQLPGVTDHCTVPATHTGLLFSDEVASQTISFLRNKRFTSAA